MNILSDIFIVDIVSVHNGAQPYHVFSKRDEAIHFFVRKLKEDYDACQFTKSAFVNFDFFVKKYKIVHPLDGSDWHYVILEKTSDGFKGKLYERLTELYPNILRYGS